MIKDLSGAPEDFPNATASFFRLWKFDVDKLHVSADVSLMYIITLCNQMKQNLLLSISVSFSPAAQMS